MNRPLIYLIISAFLFLFAMSVDAQSGWTKKKHEVYTQLSVSIFSSKDYYDLEHQLNDQGSTFNNVGVILYGEYGITDRLTGVLDVPVVAFNSFSTTETVTGTGNVRLGLKYRLLNNFPLSVQVEADIPTNNGISNARVKEEFSVVPNQAINLPTSDGEFNVLTTLAASQSFAEGKAFASLFGTVNFRTQEFSNQLTVGAELGYLFFDKLYLIGKARIQERLSSESSAAASFLYGEGTTFTSLGVTGMYKLTKHLQLVGSFSNFSDVLVKRRNIYGGNTFSLGIAAEF